MFLDNPIFRREFVALARSWKTSALISAYLVSLSLLLIILWPAGGIHSVVTDNSREIFSMFFTADLILLMMMVPAFTAGAITMERENETYQALFCTLMRPFSIMTGKLFSAILMLLILSVLPSCPILTALTSIFSEAPALFLILKEKFLSPSSGTTSVRSLRMRYMKYCALNPKDER